MALGRVLSRGQVMLPQSIRRAAGFRPGDLLSFQVTAPGKVEIAVVPRFTLAEALERYRITEAVDGDRDWVDWEAAAADEALGRHDDDD